MTQYVILTAIVADALIGAIGFLISEMEQESFLVETHWRDSFKVKHLLFLLLFPLGVLLGLLISISIKAVRNVIPLLLNFLNRPLFGKGKQVEEYHLNPKQRKRVSQNMYMVIHRLNREKDHSLRRFKGGVDTFGIFDTRFLEDINILTEWNLKMEDFFMEPRNFYNLLNSKTGS